MGLDRLQPPPIPADLMNSTIRFKITSVSENGQVIRYCVNRGPEESLPWTNESDEEALRQLAENLERTISSDDAVQEGRIRLFFEETSPEFGAAWEPWEQLKGSDGRPFACRQDTSVVRSVASLRQGEDRKDDTNTAPPRVLIVGCTPESLETLNLADEFHSAQLALGPLNQDGTAEVSIRQIDTQNQLAAAIAEWKPDIFHFIGHTIERQGERQLALNRGASGFATPLDFESLNILLTNAGCRLAILNACASHSIARQLALHGIAAIGTEDTLLDKSARLFSEGLYQMLAQGENLDAACNEGRLRVYLDDRGSKTWSYPRLYVPNERLASFQIQRDPAPLAQLHIDCPTPGNANVYLNDKLLGLTPRTLELRRNLPYTLRLESEGFWPDTRSIVAHNRRDTLSVTLRPKLASFESQIEPAVGGARVTLSSDREPSLQYETQTDSSGRAYFSEVREGSYQLSTSLELNQPIQVAILNGSKQNKAPTLTFPLELQLSQTLSHIVKLLWRRVRQPLFIAQSLIVLTLIGLVTGMYSKPSHSQGTAPDGMIFINAVTNHTVLGEQLNERNTPKLDDQESRLDWENRIARGNLIIDEIRKTSRLTQADRAWGDPPRAYLLASPLEVDITEVTVEQYEGFLRKIHENPDQWERHALDEVNETIEDLTPSNWSEQRKNPKLPVVGVDFFDAWSFSRSVGKRIPTSKEWELAARGTEGRMFPWGERFEPWRCNGFSSHRGLAPAGDPEFEDGKTPEGIYDMAGNADEWVIIQEDDSSVTAGIVGGSFVGRGPISFLPYGVFQQTTDHRNNAIGFRCVSTDQPPKGDMVTLPSGEYIIGGLRNPYFDIIRDLNSVTTANQQQTILGEPPLQVDIPSFYVDACEVSVGQYAEFMDALDTDPDLHGRLWIEDFPEGFSVQYEPVNWNRQLRRAFDLPVTGVTWFMATAYARWQGKRLPTIYEFELLMGGANGDLFPTGDQWTLKPLIDRQQMGKAAINVRETGLGRLVSVNDEAYKDSSQIFHIHGNASEWVNDPRHERGDIVYIKGGNYDHHGKYRCMRFVKDDFNKWSIGDKLETVGFRCVLDAE